MACNAAAQRGIQRPGATHFVHHPPLEEVMPSIRFPLAALLALVPFAAWAQGAAPTDPQIAAIVVAANQVDIDAGKLAQSRAQSKDVKAFAQLMVTDHSGVNKAATDLVQKLKVKPEENATSKSLKQGGDANLAKLKGLKGAEFDRAYVDNEVTYHQAVLDAVDKTLIPSAKNEELKALLVKVRPAFVAHLDHAKKLQSSLGK
jgi:putative membrane protein